MKKIITILSFILLASWCGWIAVHFRSRQEFQVIFFSIGQGDSALIKFTDGSKMLVDCGPDKGVLAKLGNYLSPYDRTLDYLVITHFDLDHYGGCIDVLKRYQVVNIITNGQSKEDKYWLAWQEQSQLESANQVVINQAVTWQIGDSQLEFIYPLANLPPPKVNVNNQSVVFRLTHQGDSFLFTGDIEGDLEDVLLDYYCAASPRQCPVLSAHILKVSHHGSGYSTSQDWLEAVSPKQAIISVGENNFGHPSLRVLLRLERAGAQVRRTDLDGDILIK